MAPIEGRPPVFRRLWPSDAQRLLRHLQRLAPEDRRCRFGGQCADEDIRAYCERLDWARTIAVGCELDGELRAVGELKVVHRGWERSAEAAVTVEREHQGQGIGTRLFRQLMTIAANRGIRNVFVICLARNSRVQRMLQRYEAELTAYDGEVEGQIRLPWPSGLTLARELLDEYASGAQAVLARPARTASAGRRG